MSHPGNDCDDLFLFTQVKLISFAQLVVLAPFMYIYVTFIYLCSVVLLPIVVEFLASLAKCDTFYRLSLFLCYNTATMS